MTVIGIDIGTTSVSAAVYRPLEDVYVDSVTRAAMANVPAKCPDWFHQDADIYAAEVKALLAETDSAYYDVQAVGLSCQMHGIVYVDAKGRALSPLVTWQDMRGAESYIGGKNYAEYISERTGYTLFSGFGAVTHFYNVKNGLVPKHARWLMTVGDYVAMQLCGGAQPLMHESNAASLGLYDPDRGDFDRETIRELGMDPDMFPSVCTGYGKVGTDAAGRDIFCAIGDNQAGFLGAVKDPAHEMLLNVGTSGQLSCLSERALRSDLFETRPFIGKQHLLVGATLCGGQAYAALKNLFCEIAQLVGADAGEMYAAMGQAMEGFVPVNPLKVRTAFCGTRRDPDVRGSIEGIDLENFTARELMAGVMQGIVDELEPTFRRFKKEVKVKRIVGVGNALKRNPWLVSCAERTFGVPIVLSENGEDAAVGAAVFAAQALKQQEETDNV